jgi:phage baseplate assembly protein W
MATGISVKLPLVYNSEDGPYQLTKTLPETIKQNFKNLVFTAPGERIMDTTFGVGIHHLLFENDNDDAIDLFKERLYDQTQKYLPFVSIVNVETEMNNHTLNVEIQYFIPQLGIGDDLVINLDI